MELQKRGIPTVSVVTEKFVNLAKVTAKTLGYPDLPMLIVPHPFETLTRERIEQIADEKFDECIALLSTQTKANND